MAQAEAYKLEIYLPTTFLETVLGALHEVGAGRIGLYDHCFAVSEVRGFYRPLDGSAPFEGAVGRVSEVAEYKVETRCAASLLPEVLRAVRRAHPYEEPSISVLPLMDPLLIEHSVESPVDDAAQGRPDEMNRNLLERSSLLPDAPSECSQMCRSDV